MAADNLVFWSAVALVVRLAAIGMLLVVAWVQVKQFRFKTNLQPLKRLLLGAVLVILVSNLPILYLHWIRVVGTKASDGVTAFATVSNAISMLIVAVLLMLVYRFRNDEPPR